MSRRAAPAAPYKPGDPITGLICCTALTHGTVVSCEPDRWPGRWRVVADMDDGLSVKRMTYVDVRSDGESDYCAKPKGDQ